MRRTATCTASTWGHCISSSAGCGDYVELVCTSLATEQLDFLLRASAIARHHTKSNMTHTDTHGHEKHHTQMCSSSSSSHDTNDCDH
eukprot:17212-Heterococcus_DN1.PRE.3